MQTMSFCRGEIPYVSMYRLTVHMRWTIRALLVAVAIIAAVLTIPRWRSFQQHFAAQKLHRRGISIVFAQHYPKQPVLQRVVFGDNAYDWVEAIKVEGEPLSNNDARRLGMFPRLTELMLYECPSADTVLLNAAKMPSSLKVLHLEASTITKDGLSCIANLRSIENLRLLDLALTDGDLTALQELPNLRYLSLRGGCVNDNILREIAVCARIQGLGMRATNVTDDGLCSLQALRQLNDLTILDSPITGTGLACLRELRELESLTLDGCPITDDGLEAIKQIRTLKVVRFNSKMVTKDAIAALVKALPKCVVGSPYYQNAGR